MCKYQTDYNISPDRLPLPSNETILRRLPQNESLENISTCKSFLRFCKTNLLNLSLEEKQNLDTIEWLQNLSKHSKFTYVNESKLQLEIQGKCFQFCIDENLTSFIARMGSFDGVYHFSLTMCEEEEEFSIVLKRIRIQDCYVLPYNYILLKSFQSRIDVVPLYSEKAWWKFEEKYTEEDPVIDFEDDEETVENLLTNHSLVSLPELFTLSDSKRFVEYYSAPIQFIAAFKELKRRFKKIKTRVEGSYKCPKSNYYEELSNNVFRHMSRLNGENVLLVENCLWYDLLQKGPGSIKFNIYKDNFGKIPDGEIFGVSGDPLPEYILCANEQVLKLREDVKKGKA